MNARFPWFVLSVTVTLAVVAIVVAEHCNSYYAAGSGFACGVWLNLFVIKLAYWVDAVQTRRELREFEKNIYSRDESFS